MRECHLRIMLNISLTCVLEVQRNEGVFKKMSEGEAPVGHSSSVKRMFYADNIRIYLTILVILHHVAVAYGGAGDWPIKEPATDPISPILFVLFNAVNQSYFMSFFFLLSGYFTPRSYDKKGSKSFLKGRLIRLGIPLLSWLVFIAPFEDYILSNFAYGREVSFFDILASNPRFRIEHFPSDPSGHLWFLQALLLFAGVYVLYRIITHRYVSNYSFKSYEDAFPTNKIIVISIAVIALGTFMVRLWFPVGVWVFSFQLGHIVHYIFCFWLGILAYRGKWFSNLSESQAKLWGKVALVTIPILPVPFVLGSSDNGLDVFLGGMHWQAFTYAVWESVALLSISIWLLHIFQKKFNQQGGLLKGMSPNVYTVYIIHHPVVVAILIPFLSIALPTVVKFLIVSLIAVPVCFLISHFIIRKIPYATRVLG